jgi:hypothetical protein
MAASFPTSLTPVEAPSGSTRFHPWDPEGAPAARIAGLIIAGVASVIAGRGLSIWPTRARGSLSGPHGHRPRQSAAVFLVGAGAVRRTRAIRVFVASIRWDPSSRPPMGMDRRDRRGLLPLALRPRTHPRANLKPDALAYL